MKYRYLLVMFLFALHAVTSAQEAAGDNSLLALNMTKSSELNMAVTEYRMPAPSRRGGSAGDGVRYVSLYESIDIGSVSVSSKYHGLSAKGSGFKYQLEVGAKIPVVFTEYSQFIVSGAVYYQEFSARRVFCDTLGTKQNFEIYTIGIPLTMTVVHLNRKGNVLGYYYEAGVNVGGIYRAKSNGDEYNKQFNGLLLQPHAGAGMSLAMDGGEHLNNRTVLLGFYVSDAVTSMVRTDGVTMHAMMYGFKYTWVIN